MRYVILIFTLFIVSCNSLGDFLFDTHWVKISNETGDSLIVYYYPEKNQSDRDSSTLSGSSVQMTSLDTNYSSYVFEFPYLINSSSADSRIVADISNGVSLQLNNTHVRVIKRQENEEKNSLLKVLNKILFK